MLACDVTEEASVVSFASEVLARTGRIDVLVNNAGVGLLGGAEGSSATQVQRRFDVTLCRLMPSRRFDRILRRDFGLPG